MSTLASMVLEDSHFAAINTVVFSIIGVVVTLLLLLTIAAIIKHFKPDLLSTCCQWQEARSTQVEAIPSKRTEKKERSGPGGSTVGPQLGQYLTLEDHLDTILDTPVKRATENKETPGYTLEFFPDDNTVVQIEGTSSKITKITKTKIRFGEKISQQDDHAVFSGELNDARILIFIVSLTEAIYSEIKTYVMERDRGLPILVQHPRYLRYLGTCFNPQKLEAYIIR